MPRTYVNNASNRSLGRVGMPVGSMPVSRGSGGSSGGGKSSNGSSSSSSYGSSSSSSKTYVDNAYNRQHGRVGLPHGSAVISASGNSESSSSSSGTKTYVDNPYNRQHQRVGLAHGEAVISASGNSDSSASISGTKTYVDNAYNRQHQRVGLPHGEASISKSKSSDTSLKSNSGDSPKVYKDNPLNRRLGRAGKPIGTCVVSKSESAAVGVKHEAQVYADNPQNRRLGRAGKPRGSMPQSRVSKETETTRQLRDQIWDGTIDYDLDYEYENDKEMAKAISQVNRRLEELTWRETEGDGKVKTSSSVVDQYKGIEISFADLQLGKKIGQGGFGDVFFAKWYGSVVAVKKLRVQRVSKQRRDDFAKEVTTFGNLDHPNIVKFIGACLKTPNLCIVMEYMQTCLYTALYMSDDDIEFSEKEQLSILQQTADGVCYLHHNLIAHCDLKSQNVLLDYEPGVACVAKITDFGLSMMKSNSESSASSAELVRNVGTPRYSSPEVLRGEMLSAKTMMLADMYSFGLIVFEVLFQEEPFYGLNYAQLQKQVGEKGLTPAIPESTEVNGTIQKIMKECWDFNPKSRPEMSQVLQVLNQQTWLYEA